MKLEVGNQYVLTDGTILTVEKLLHTPLYGVNGKSVYICTISDAYGFFYYTKNGLHIFDYMPSVVSLKNKFEIGKRYVTRNGTEIILTAITLDIGIKRTIMDILVIQNGLPGIFDY